MKRVALLVVLSLSGCAMTPAPDLLSELDGGTSYVQPESVPPVPPVPAGMQWLYGSAEASVATQQVFRSLRDHVLNRIEAPATEPRVQVILASGSTPDQPRFDTCGNKPLAAVFDADETLLFNLGAMRAMAERGKDFDPAIWDQWEKTGAGKAVAIPGAADALADLRTMGVTIIVNTNRSAANAKGTEDTLRAAGLGDFQHGKTLFLLGDAPDGSSKDGRRAMIADTWCVIAMVGDQLGDFAQAFNAKALSVADRKLLANSDGIADLWGEGWFLLPNPVYGPSIRGDYDDIFPADSRWSPPTETEEAKP